jgi:hypothetical protein
MIFNPLYFLATAALGFGFSLAIYRPVALHYGWPMGMMQSRHPLMVSLLGTAALVLAFLYIIGDATQRWPIMGLGMLLALFWLGFLRVASQTSLFLAPIAAMLLGVLWASTDDGMREIRSVEEKVADRTMKMEQRLEESVKRLLQRRQGQPVPWADDRTEPLAPTPTPPIIRPAPKTTP